MIAVDCNVLAYFLLPHDRFTAPAERLYANDPLWCAPPLWRSELRNILLKHVRHRGLSLDLAIGHMTSAEAILSGRTIEAETEEILRIAESSGCSAYDAEYVAVAKAHDTHLVTADRQLIAAFPGITIALGDA